MRYSVLLFALAIEVTGFSQSGPGGVGNSSSISMWIRTDAEAFSNAGTTPAIHGDRIRQVNDQSGNGRDAFQTTTANKPYYIENSQNQKPGMRFTGNTFIDGPSLGMASNSSYTYIFTFKDTATNLGSIYDGAGVFIIDRTTPTYNLVSLKQISGNKYGFQKRNNSNGYLGGPVSTTSINTNVKSIQMLKNYDYNHIIYYNAQWQDTVYSVPDGPTTPPNPRIGRHCNVANDGLKGYIYEFVMYTHAINTAQTIIVNNYLGAKYDYSLLVDDFYTQDDTTNGNYDYDVAGIGRIDTGNLHNDAQGTGPVRIQSPSDLDDNEFLIWGRNLETWETTCDDVPNAIQMRLQCDWAASEVGDVGTVNFRIDLSGFPGAIDSNQLRLLIDDDGVFSSGATVLGPPNSLDSGIYEWTGVDINDSNHFTIGTTGQWLDSLGVDTTICTGDTLLLDATTINATYLWQNSSTDSIFSVSQPGTYWVETTWNNCISSDTLEIEYNPALFIGNDTTLCENDSLELNAFTENATYVWQNSTTDSLMMVNEPGTYWVQVNQPNCVQSDTIEITYSVKVNLGNDTILCPGDSLPLDVSAANATYLWQDSSTNATFTVFEDGTYWVGKTELICYTADTIKVFFVKPIDLGNDSTLCPDASYYLDAFSPNATYDWNDTTAQPRHFVDQPGSYSVIVSNGNCTLYDTINIEYLQPINLGRDTNMCPGDSLVLGVTTDFATYLWQDDSSNPTYLVTEEGLYWAEVYLFNCVLRDEVVIEYIKAVDLGEDTTLCPGTGLTLDATTKNGTYLWQNIFKQPTYNVIRPGIYWTVVHTQHCILSDTVEVDYFDSLRVHDDFTLCPGDSQFFEVSMPDAESYLWQDGTTLSSMQLNEPGLYWAEVRTNNCRLADTVHVLPYEFVDLGNDTTFCAGDRIKLEPKIPHATYLWQDFTTRNFYTVNHEGTYWVEISVEGCAPDRDTVNIELVKCGCSFYFPNALTPNSDNINDVIAPSTDCEIVNFHLMIFDRWGNKVFETNDLEAFWDGRQKGSHLPQGVYAYQIHYATEDDDQVKFGYITLL